MVHIAAAPLRRSGQSAAAFGVRRDQAPPYASNNAELFGIVSGFESAYGAYAEFQRRLERYWSLRWLGRRTARIALPF